ncbi:hypothetical protein DPMN_168946 [Dreissena polymorpha]|uniref:Uncharacterized protein n=1 Tax=Dreissena polymorpha TaxID=45954 RepID=A0A9D4F3R3_DREPO|nr:hypothetical protein DPMN_168946 [Dreissena polymorpha]
MEKCQTNQRTGNSFTLGSNERDMRQYDGDSAIFERPSRCRRFRYPKLGTGSHTYLPEYTCVNPFGAVVSGESVAKGTLTDPEPEYASESDETWQICVARWATYPQSSSARLGAVISGESVAECTLTGSLKSHPRATKLGRLVPYRYKM